jgi:hypothetical protein
MVLEELNSHLPPKASQMTLYYNHDILDQGKPITQLSQGLLSLTSIAFPNLISIGPITNK